MGRHRKPPLIVGERYGTRTVVGPGRDRANADGSLSPTSEVRCDCGEVSTVKNTRLRRNNGLTCKKCRDANRGVKMRLLPFEASFKALRRKNETRRQSVGLVFDLTLEEYQEFTKNTECHYCLFPLRWASHNNISDTQANNLDRKNSSLGYSFANCAPCCKFCNREKNEHHSYESFLMVTKPYRDGQWVRMSDGHPVANRLQLAA